ncbi:MAG: hypothetical protein OXU50_02185 [Gammaproteobacteria bacterium]|nr:hypothetical protein [Gammaproteobacteria bacterium]
MMETNTQLPITNEIASVIWAKKCAVDRGFLAQIKADAATAFEGGALPASMEVRAVQNTADTLNICVPGYRGLEDAVNQLSDEQMAGVSGGLFFLFGLLGLIGTAGAVGAAAAVGAGAAAAGGAMIAESQNTPADGAAA